MNTSLQERLPPLGETLVDQDEILTRFLDYVAERGLELYRTTVQTDPSFSIRTVMLSPYLSPENPGSTPRDHS